MVTSLLQQHWQLVNVGKVNRLTQMGEEHHPHGPAYLSPLLGNTVDGQTSQLCCKRVLDQLNAKSDRIFCSSIEVTNERRVKHFSLAASLEQSMMGISPDLF